VGLLLKIALITFVLLFVIIKVGNFVFRNVLWMMGTESVRRQKQTQAAPPPRQKKGHIYVEPVPEKEARHRRSGFNGGEYVDYEEVK
jgi:hypothetical protein